MFGLIPPERAFDLTAETVCVAEAISATTRLTTYTMPTIAIAAAAIHTGINQEVAIAALTLAKEALIPVIIPGRALLKDARMGLDKTNAPV